MKTILFSIFILSISLSGTNENGPLSGENGKLSGVVTFRDSYETSFQADAGAEIYALNEADVRTGQYDDLSTVIDNFKRNKSAYSLARYNTLDLTKSIKLQDNFDALSKVTSKYISGFKQLPGIVKAATNGAGNFTLNLRPGKYYILVVSGSVTSNNITENKGNIDYRTVIIKPAGETFLNADFEKHENILIMLITARKQEGC